MAAHFWLQSKSVPLTLEAIARLNDEQARQYFAELRWGFEDQQVCPECGVVDRHHNIRTRKQWRCKHCFRSFSVTSGTPFADLKIGYRKLLLAIFAFILNQKGLGATALMRIIGGQYRTSFTLLHKIREALVVSQAGAKLSGIVEIDGGHFSGKLRKGKTIKKPTAADKTKVPAKYAQHRTKVHASAFPHHPNRRIVIVLREIFQEKSGNVHPHTGLPLGMGASRTIVAVCASENAADIEALVKRFVEPGTLIRTDEWPAYGNLKLLGYEHETVNHSKEFSTPTGINQNQAESFFSRMRRAVIGIYHRITPRYMLDYTVEMAWREDMRRKNTEQQMQTLVRSVFKTGISKDWINYCRGNKRPFELLFQATSP